MGHGPWFGIAPLRLGVPLADREVLLPHAIASIRSTRGRSLASFLQVQDRLQMGKQQLDLFAIVAGYRFGFCLPA